MQHCYLHCDLLTGRGREGKLAKYYDRWRVQPFGPGVAIEQHAAVFAPAQADSTVAKLKIEIIFFDGQRASPMSPGRPPNDFGGRDGIRTQDLLIPDEEKSEIRHGAAIT